MSEIMKNIKYRRSIRKFQKKQVTDKELETVLEAGIYAPTGNNLQNCYFTAVQNPEKLRKLNDLVKIALERQNREDYNFYYNAPTFIIVSNDSENTNGLADCSCAMQNMALLTHSIGLGSCWINQLKDISDQPKIREMLTEFGMPKNNIAWAVLALGYIDSELEVKVPTRSNDKVSYYR